LIIVISGPGGVGKGTVVKELLARDERLWVSRSWTTRSKRPGEAADAYHFVTEDAFEGRIDDGGFLEWATFGGHLYGTPWPEPPRPDLDIVLEIDVQGAAQVRERYPDALLVFLEAPSRDAQEARLRGRGDPEHKVQERLAVAEAEEKQGRELGASFVVNEAVESTVAELETLIAQARAGQAG
jgi:guanylate kinase